ncbi:hypothetical protein O181_112852 [Austropuccinia psidii MF-1]|uniref:Uncharacterized protein n=1 Tax=Austropuccinia psidii MF-1 TaxID=1389203 RepID=A0A9Q3K4H5_9BASI|nr:hypothetical protein [Austropuccinia psidii MF-1]
MTPDFEEKDQYYQKALNQLQNSPKTIPKDPIRRIKVPRKINSRGKEKPIFTDLTHNGTGSPNWSLQPWTVLNMARTLMEFTAKEQEKMTRTFQEK